MELRDPHIGAPLGKLLGVQVKSTESGKYIRETDRSFEYLLKLDDLVYWRTTENHRNIASYGVSRTVPPTGRR